MLSWGGLRLPYTMMISTTSSAVRIHRRSLQTSVSPGSASPPSSSAPILRRLPVPHLKDTLQKYLVSLEPFLLEDDAASISPYDKAREKVQHCLADFESGLGQDLQARLLALEKESPHNWLDDNFWLKIAYHSWRSPLIVNSNWWLSFINDAAVPKAVLKGNVASYEVASTGVSSWQIRRATWLTYRLIELRARMARNEIYDVATREGVWLQRTASLVYGTARIPNHGCDRFSKPPSHEEPASRCIILFVHNLPVAVEVLDPNHQPVSASEIEHRIYSAVCAVGDRIKHGFIAPPISVLSADHRDKWTKNFEHLLSISPNNRTIHQVINNSLFAVSLDHYTHILPIPPHGQEQSIIPDSNVEIDSHLHNLRSGRPSHPAHNRWYDKPLNLIIESNTRAGALGEHSPVDALVPSILCEYAVAQDIDRDTFGYGAEEIQARCDGPIDGVRLLNWDVDEQVRVACVEAEHRIKPIVEDSDDSVLWFQEYGADWIKTATQLSPDAYIQMAFQLAWYRTQKYFTATYETALTRIFHHGRTETIRTLSAQSRAFVLAMEDPTSTPVARVEHLRRAVASHTSSMRAAATGKGIDRHLLGLRLLLREGETHPLFEDPLFLRSQTWKLSTSGLSAGHYFRGTGFGASEQDGYGINYLAGPSIIKFGIESKLSSPHTSTQQFKVAIAKSLLDMKELFCAPISAQL